MIFLDGFDVWLVLGLVVCFVVIHELTHAAVAYGFGCYAVHYSVTWRGVRAESECLLKPEVNTAMLQSQALVETIQYPLLIFVVLGWLFYVNEREKSEVV